MARRLLGFIESKLGIHLDPLKVQAILKLPHPSTSCQLQSLQGKVNFLRRYIPYYTTQAHGFLHLLRQSIPFKWDDYAQIAFDALKLALTNVPLISPPDFTKNFILYVSTSTYVVVGVLIQEDVDHHERAIYYISKTLTGLAIHYSHDKKLALVVVLST